MYKATNRFFLAVFTLFLVLGYNSQAQLEPGNIGIGAFFAGDNPSAIVNYTLNEQMDVSVGLGYNNAKTESDNPNTPDGDVTTLRFQGIFRFFLKKGKDVSPYVGGVIHYISYPGQDLSNYKYTDSEMGLMAIFGGQVYLAKGLAVYGHIGLGFSTRSQVTDNKGSETSDIKTTITTLSLNGSGVGAVFYFDL